MTASKKRLYDVFVSSTAHDAALARVARNVFEEAGLSAFAVGDAESAQRLTDEAWQALAESWAFVAIVTPLSVESPNVTLELGAASAWNKPVFLLLDGMVAKELPRFLRRFDSAPSSEVQRVARKVLALRQPLSDEQRSILMGLYGQHGVSVDDLIMEPIQLDRLTREFNDQSGTVVASEQLVQALLRMRKQGKLVRFYRQPKTRNEAG